MTKLVSKNPVLRFKEGRRIEKFGDGGVGGSWIELKLVGAMKKLSDPDFWFNTSGKYLTFLNLNNPLIYILRQIDRGLNAAKSYVTGETPNTKTSQSNVGPLETSVQSDRAAAKARIALSNKNLSQGSLNKGVKTVGNKTNTGGTTTPVVKSTPTSFMGQGIQQGWRGTVGKAPELTDLLKLQLINTGKFTDNDFTTAGALQTALNNYFGGTVGSISVDNKWGSLSQKALNAALAATKDPGTYMNLSLSLDLPNLDGTKTRTNIHGRYNITGLLSNKMTNPTPTINLTTASPAITPQISNVNVNRAQTRNLMRAHNLNPYDYSGAQRKALRNFYSTGNYDSNLLSGIISKDYKWLKQGGLISRNPVKQFKVNFRKEAL